MMNNHNRLKTFKKNRIKIGDELNASNQTQFFSSATYYYHVITEPLIDSNVHGKLIDLGCGDMPYKKIILKKVKQYDTLDIEKRVPNVKYVGNIEDMNMIEDKSYDSAICLEVLEHVPHPLRAINEIHRILKNGGRLVLTVPHLSRLHEEPFDYFRYTIYALRKMFKENGFKEVYIVPHGGIISFLGHQMSTMLLCSTWNIPIIKNISFFVNKYLFIKFFYFIDKFFDGRKIFALGYSCVFEKL